MRSILHPEGRRMLARFARMKSLLAFDFDGTLAPIVEDPDRARLRPTTRRLLSALARRYPCAVISGRSRGDVLGRLAGIPLRCVVGNHGVDGSRYRSAYEDEVRRWRAILEDRLATLPGVSIEDKGVSLSIHFRKSPRKRHALATIRDAAARLDPIRVIGGKDIVNLLPARAPHKGTALETMRRRLRCDAALYVGDDETDEDVFSLKTPDRLLTIRVGPKRGSSAAYFIQTQAGIDALLRALVLLRPQAPST